MEAIAATLGGIGGSSLELLGGLLGPVVQTSMAKNYMSWMADSVGMKPGEFALATSSANPAITQYRGNGSFQSHRLYGVAPEAGNVVRFPGATRAL